MKALLVTIPISHYCERGRWALDRAGVPYVEHRYAPLFHARASMRLSKGTSTPKLRLSDGTVHADSDAIVRYADGLLGGALTAHQTPELRALELRLCKSFGPAVRRYAYHTMLKHPRRVVPLLTDRCPTYQRVAFVPLVPLAFGVMRRSMNIREETANRDRDKLHALLDEVADVLSDGRPYLDGARFGATDLTFASLASPLTESPGHPVKYPPLATLPEPLRAEVGALQDHPALAHVRTCYRLERWPS